MNTRRILGIIRHLVGIAAGILVGLGYIDEGTSKELTGAGLGFLAVLASILAPEKKG